MDKKWFEHLASWLRKRGRYRDIEDRESRETYMERYYVMFKDRPSWFPFNVVLHRILKSDPDGLHDHPWPFSTIILKGGYWEVQPKNLSWRPEQNPGKQPEIERVWRRPNGLRFRASSAYHRLELDREKAGGDTWTLFFMGPKMKEWGFLNENSIWEKWDDYLARRKIEKNRVTQKESHMV
jgi:hypothetical protein